MKTIIKYYKIVVRGNARGGVLYAPPSWPRPIAKDGEDVRNWESLVVELKDGPYRNFNMCVGFANVVSEAFKDLIQNTIGDNHDLEFLPIQVISEKYGNRTYYIMHFRKVFDVVDTQHSTYVPNTDSIIKLCVDYTKVKDLQIFNSNSYSNDVILSNELRLAIKRNHLDDGIEFYPIYCVKEE